MDKGNFQKQGKDKKAVKGEDKKTRRNKRPEEAACVTHVIVIAWILL